MFGNTILISMLMGILFWVAFVITFFCQVDRHSVHKHMKQLQFVFLLHLWFTVALCFILIIRPFWKSDIHNMIFRSEIICNIYARTLLLIYVMLPVLVIYFSFLKTKIYGILLNEERGSFVDYFVYFGFALAIVCTVTITPKKSNHGVKDCNVWNSQTQASNYLFMIWSCIMSWSKKRLLLYVQQT